MKRIIIHSVPRSGSSWLGTLFDSHPQVLYRFQPLFSYAFKGRLSPVSSADEIDHFFTEIAKSQDPFINQDESKQGGFVPDFGPKKEATHICYKEVRYHHILENLLAECSDLKAVFLIRNPLATLYSWSNAPREFKRELGWDFEKEWLEAPSKNLSKPEEFNGYLKWKQASTMFLDLEKKFPNRVKLVSYMNLLNHTRACMEELFEFCQLQMGNQTRSFIHTSKTKHQDDAYSVFKNKSEDDGWKTGLAPDIIDHVTSDLKGTALEQFLT